MADKDFLEQFSNKKPESFKEEERIPVVKNKKPVNKVLVIVLAALAVILLVVGYFVFLAPKIEMPEFVGQTKTDVAAWIKQQGIEPSGIIFKDEYSFDYDENYIIYQSETAGKKVKNNVKITFTISKGADPDEKIAVPNLESMDREQITKWIQDNKLQKTKITTTYSDTVEEGYVISYAFTGVEEDEFTRGSTLKITISKGPQPVETVTVENFVGKLYSDASTWATNKKLKITKVESYSDKVEAGYVISQSVEAGQKITANDLLTFTVSIGKGIKMPNLASMTREEVNKFLMENGVSASQKYSTDSNYVISQSPAAGKVVGLNEKIEVTTNLGSTYYLSDIGMNQIVGVEVSKIVDILNNIRSKGIDAFAGAWSNPDGVYSYEFEAGQIVSVIITDTSGNVYNANDRLPLDTRFDVLVSKGKIYKVDGLTVDTDNKYNTATLVDKLASLGISFSVQTQETTCELWIDDVQVIATDFEIIQNSKVELK